MTWKEILIRYRSGEMPAGKRYGLEKRSLDDSFLGDALEGISMHQQTDLESRMDGLDARLANFQEKRGVEVRMKWWPYAVAASVALVVLIGNPLDADLFTGPETTAVHTSPMAKPDDPVVSDLATESSFQELQDQLEEWTESEMNHEPEYAENTDQQSDLPQAPPDRNKDPGDAWKQIAGTGAVTATPTEDHAALTESINSEEELGKALPRSPAAALRSKALTLEEVEDYVQPNALVESLDTTDWYPEIGFEKVKMLNKEWRESIKTDLFMRGIRSGGKVTVQFEVDTEGLPVRLSITPEMGEYLDEKIGDFVRSTGIWIVSDPSQTLALTVYY